MFDPHAPSKSLAQEIALVDYVERLDRFRNSSRIAVQINLSLLASSYKRDSYLRIATETFASSIRNFEGRLFEMRNSDLLFIAKEATVAELDSAVDRIRVLFGGDPILINKDMTDGRKFCNWYRISTDYNDLLEMAKGYLATAENETSVGSTVKQPAYQEVLTAINPNLLARLEQSLSKTDVSNVVRRQTVCTMFESQQPQPLFEEIYVSIDDLQRVATPGVDLLGNRWLFQYLTQTLDLRVLAMLMRDGVKGDKPFSLNLNVSTVLSPDFLRFEQIISPQLRGRLVIEMNKIDVFSDMGAFLFARDYLRDHGFRLCLDGLTHHTLAYYDRSLLGFDLIKIYWTPDSIDNMMPEMVPSIRNIIMDAGQARTILCRCESERAIEMGQNLGIVMFQGRYVEQELNKRKPYLG